MIKEALLLTALLAPAQAQASLAPEGGITIPETPKKCTHIGKDVVMTENEIMTVAPFCLKEPDLLRLKELYRIVHEEPDCSAELINEYQEGLSKVVRLVFLSASTEFVTRDSE